ncbi:uncharacterized protein LOC100574339 [Acyrthosiphon pisum]|uniref:THAP-type domain-containing protein n=1 Tax=Acyrthosiphon pisum TaxID=7029 RepID=A0A8R1W619_ACYPI|nr:uncharacterized protein LOC100574339 [Acyrthosiphon pisum]|eukprot:XP_003244087.1 PREDICTED: uncharacterized protein LOC100574339 [Acyrthosiphon pisum]
MVYKCSVSNCLSHDKTFRKCTLFSVPTDPILNKLWNNVVSGNNNKVTIVKKICELHFTNDDLVRTYVNWPDDVSDHRMTNQMIVPRLQKGAVPSLFGNSVNKSFADCSEITPILASPQFSTEIPLCRIKLDRTCSTQIDSSTNSNCNSLEMQALFSDDDSSFNNSDNHQDQIKELHFIDFFKQLKSINLPTGWSYIENEITLIFFSMKIQNEDIPKANVGKQIVILHNFQILCYAFNVQLKPSNFNLKSFEVGPNNIEKVVNLLMSFDKKNICIGGPKAINFSGISVKSAKLNDGIWHHNNCTVVIDSHGVNRCKECKKLFATFRVNKSRHTRGNVKKNISQTSTPNRKCSLSNIIKQKHELQVSNIRLKNNIQKTINKLGNLQKKMENITFDNLQCNANLNEPQIVLINEIIKTNSVKSRNRRYSEN